MNKADVSALMASVSLVVKEFVATAVSAVRQRADEAVAMAAALDQRFAALPVPKDGLPGSSAFQIACLGGFQGSEGEWLESLCGKDGPPVDVEIVRLVAAETLPGMVERARDMLSEQMHTHAIPAALADAVAALPAPQDGKSVDEAVVREIITAEVARAVLGLPPATPGKNAEPVDYDQVMFRVKQSVAEAVAALPAPKDGKSVEPEAVLAMVVAEVAKIPRAKDADPEFIRAAVDKNFASLADEFVQGMADAA